MSKLRRKAFGLLWSAMPGVVLVAGGALLWEFAAIRANSPNVPGLGSVVQSIVRNSEDLLGGAAHTVGRAIAGLAIAALTMIPLGLVSGRIRPFGDAVSPIIDILRPLPPIAIAPVAMIFAGTGSTAKIAVITYGCAFPILINTFDAVREAHPMFTRVAASLGLSRRDAMRMIDLPAALPQVLSGVRTSVALSLLISVSSEMILSSDGLGDFIVKAQQRFQIAEEIGAILVVILLGLIVSMLWSMLDRRLLAWHYAYLARLR